MQRVDALDSFIHSLDAGKRDPAGRRELMEAFLFLVATVTVAEIFPLPAIIGAKPSQPYDTNSHGMAVDLKDSSGGVPSSIEAFFPPSPLDLSGATSVRRTIDMATGENRGLIRYQDFLNKISGAGTLILGEPHLTRGDDITHREIIRVILQGSKPSNVVVALGRFTPSDNGVLEKFIRGGLSRDEDEALRELVKQTSLRATGFLETTFTSDNADLEFGNNLRIYRRLGIRTIGLGTDSVVQEGTPEVYQDQIKLYPVKELGSAKIIAEIEKANPNSKVVAIVGPIHAQRGQEGAGITSKLESIHGQDMTLRERKVAAVNIIATGFSTYGGFIDDLKLALGGGIPGNSVFVVDHPRFAQPEWEFDATRPFEERLKRVPSHTGFDYMVFRKP